jgi:hypothetical protein
MELDSGDARRLRPVAAIPAPHAADLAEFEQRLRDSGVHGAIRFLNSRTPHRFTGVYRFDGDMLRNVALIDKWLPSVETGDDVPLGEAFCAHLHATGEPLEVVHGPTDSRVPWMSGSPIVSYCGSVICDEDGERWGALCHFDTSACESKSSDMPLLAAAASMIYRAASARPATRTSRS